MGGERVVFVLEDLALRDMLNVYWNGPNDCCFFFSCRHTSDARKPWVHRTSTKRDAGTSGTTTTYTYIHLH